MLRSPKLTCAGRTIGVKFGVEDFGGSVKLLAWAKDNGCPWNADTCAVIAKGGRLEVLQWARAHDCPWDGRIIVKTPFTTGTRRCCSERGRMAARGTRACSAHGRAVQVVPINPTLEAPGTQRFKVEYDYPLSNFAFKFIFLRRYIVAPGVP